MDDNDFLNTILDSLPDAPRYPSTEYPPHEHTLSSIKDSNKEPPTESVTNIYKTTPYLRFLTVLDLHLSPITPSSRRDNFLESTEDALSQVYSCAKKIDACAVIFAGDIFHIKSATRNPPWFLTRAISSFNKAKDLGIQNLVVAGNHDLVFGSIDSLPQQPLGVLVKAGTLHLLDNSPYIYSTPTFSVKVAGSSFLHSLSDPVRDLKKGSSTHLISVGHFWFGEKTQSYYGEPMYGPEYFSSSEADIFVIGHHHADFGIVHAHDKIFYTHGSINRVGAHKDDATRLPSYGIIDITSEGISTSIVRVVAPPFEEIFDLTRYEDLVREKEELTSFLEGLNDSVVVEGDIYGILGALTLPSAVFHEAKNYIQAVEEGA